MVSTYLVQNGTILSVLTGSYEKADIRVRDGMIEEIGTGLSKQPEEALIDASGLIITTGWVDAHCHIGVEEDGIGIEPFPYLLSQGVTYALDLGTAGTETFEYYRRNVRFKTDLKYRSYLNMGKYGMHDSRKDTEMAEDVDLEAIRKLYREYPAEILGLKIRIDPNFCFAPQYMLNVTRQLADELALPMVVHAPRCPLPLETVLSYLKEGDVLAHTLAGLTPQMKILDESGKLRPCVTEAQGRGVIFDLSHGTNQYSFQVAEQAWNNGFLPDIISSDIHHTNIHGPVFNLATIISKMRGLTGLDWTELLRRVTVVPAEKLHLTDKQLEIKVGEKVDLTAFKIENGTFTYEDSAKEHRTYPERLKVCYTLIGDKIYCGES